MFSKSTKLLSVELSWYLDGDSLRACKPSLYVTSHPVQLSLAILPWLGAMVLVMVTATAAEENSKFCVAVGLATRTVGILTSWSKTLAVEPACHPADLGHILA